MAYDRIVPKPKPNQLSQPPLIPGHLGQTLHGQRLDILLSPRCYWEFGQQSKSQVEQIGHAKITQTDAFNYMSLSLQKGDRPTQARSHGGRGGLSPPPPGQIWAPPRLPALTFYRCRYWGLFPLPPGILSAPPPTNDTWLRRWAYVLLGLSNLVEICLVQGLALLGHRTLPTLPGAWRRFSSL